MYEYKVSNVKVIDGDTVECDVDLGFDVILKKQKVRLYNVNAPEVRTKNKEEKEKGLKAKERLEELLNKEGTEVYLLSLKYDRGKYGRILGDFVINKEVRVTDVLIAENLVTKYS